MKKLNLALLFCLNTAIVTAQPVAVPNSISDVAAKYTTLLRNHSFTEASHYLHPSMAHIMSPEDWIRAQEATVSTDRSRQIMNLTTNKAQITTKSFAGHSYYLLTVDETLQIPLENGDAVGEPEATAETIQDFIQKYGEDNVQQIDMQHFVVTYSHYLMILPLEEDTTQWRVIDFPDGRLNLAYGIIPANVWQGFFPKQGIASHLNHTQAVPQAVGRYFQLLKTKAYNVAERLTLTQNDTPARFMKWFKSLDNETTNLHYLDYNIMTPLRTMRKDGQRYTGFELQLTLRVSFITDNTPEEDIVATQELLEEIYLNHKMIYDEETQAFTFKVSYPAIAVADASKNNWKLLLEDRINGMSIDQNITREIANGVGLN